MSRIQKAVLLATAMLVIAAGFIFFIKKTDVQSSRITRLQTRLTESESEYSKLLEKYNELKTELEAVKQTKAEQSKKPVVYLTFDDGPSQNTVKILEVLKSYGVKATFFVTGKTDDVSKTIYRQIVTDGHGYGNHTFCHEYNIIYKSTDAFWQEIQKNDDNFYSATGKHLSIIRFPGGSNNTVSERYCKGIMKQLTEQAKQKNIKYFDWNVSTLDAEAAVQSKNVIINEAISGCKNKKSAVVLMHDSAGKKTTVEALPTIIEALLNQGFRFGILNEQSEQIHF